MYREDLSADWSTGDDPHNYTLSDHSAIITKIKSNCKIRIKKFVMSELYKLAPFLSLPMKQTQFTKATNKLGGELSGALHLDLDEINRRTAEGLKSVSKTEVGISVNKRTEDTGVYTGVKEVNTTLKATRECPAQVHRLEGLGDPLEVQRSKEEHKTAQKSCENTEAKGA